jgi:hypothetical protein
MKRHGAIVTTALAARIYTQRAGVSACTATLR